MQDNPLLLAIERLAPTWKGRAEHIDITERQLLTWRKKGPPSIIAKLEAAGVIHVTGFCPCARHLATSEQPEP